MLQIINIENELFKISERRKNKDGNKDESKKLAIFFDSLTTHMKYKKCKFYLTTLSPTKNMYQK